MFLVMAYRWGIINEHHYIVGLFSNKEIAMDQAKDHVGYRGGKYSCVVYDIIPDIDLSQADRVYEQIGYFGIYKEDTKLDYSEVDLQATGIGYEILRSEEDKPLWLISIIQKVKERVSLRLRGL